MWGEVPSRKDHYSDQRIRVGSRVTTLWSYESQNPDELTLKRGDTLQVKAIYTDGWASGVLIKEKAGQSMLESNETRLVPVIVDKFPLVCVSLSRHWREKMIEQELSFEDQDNALEADWIVIQNPILIGDPVEESDEVKIGDVLYENKQENKTPIQAPPIQKQRGG
jgi:hypothetical protein